MSIYGGPDIVTDGLVCYFDFANSKCYPRSGSVAVDLSNYGNTASLQNSPTFDSDNYGNLSLNGTNNRVAITPVSNLIRNYNSTTLFTVKLPVWSGGQRCILSYRGTGAGTGGGELYLGKSSNGIFVYYNELNTPAYTVGNVSANSLIIAHVTCDNANNTLGIYINGTLTGSVSRTGWVATYASSAFYLGYDNGGTAEYMLGNFYQFAHYNKVLSSNEILQNYNTLKGRFGL
jgi:hypothetical protein